MDFLIPRRSRGPCGSCWLENTAFLWISSRKPEGFPWLPIRKSSIKKLAGILRENLDMDRIYEILDRRL